MAAGSAQVPEEVRPRSRQQGWRSGYEPDRRRPIWRRLIGSPMAVGSLGFLLLVVLCALLAGQITPVDPEFVDPGVRFQGPSAEHWLGTDDLGRDVLSRLVYGARVSLLVGGLVTILAAITGSFLGLVAGYYVRLDSPIMRILDGFMAFPGILLAIAIVMSLGDNLVSVIVALSIVYTPVVARLMRSSVLVLKTLPYVDSARATGLSDPAILWRYIFANSLSPLIVQCTFIAAYAIIAEASLSFLGASIDPETPTWGNMLRDGQRVLSRAWWIAIFPGIVLFLTTLALNVFGDELRDALDPRAAERRRDGVVR